MIFSSVNHETLLNVSFNTHVKLIERCTICDKLLYVDWRLFVHVSSTDQSCKCEEHWVCRLCLFAVKQLQLHRIIGRNYEAIQICVTKGVENSVKQLLLRSTKFNLVATDVT